MTQEFKVGERVYVSPDSRWLPDVDGEITAYEPTFLDAIATIPYKVSGYWVKTEFIFKSKDAYVESLQNNIDK